MLKKLWLMKKSRSRDNCVDLNETLYIIRKKFIFTSNDFWWSDLNFRTRILIKSSFKRLKFYHKHELFFFHCWHVQQTFLKNSFVSFHLKISNYFKKFIIYIDKTYTNNMLKEFFKKKFIIRTLHNENRNRYCNIFDAYKDSFTNIKETCSFINNIYYNYINILTHK